MYINLIFTYLTQHFGHVITIQIRSCYEPTIVANTPYTSSFLAHFVFGSTLIRTKGIPTIFLLFYVLCASSTLGCTHHWNANLSNNSSHNNTTQALALQEPHFLSSYFHTDKCTTTVFKRLAEQEIYLLPWPIKQRHAILYKLHIGYNQLQAKY